MFRVTGFVIIFVGIVTAYHPLTLVLEFCMEMLPQQ